MKFFGTGIIWNAEKECELCRFKKTGLRKGELETTDPKLIENLKNAGYKYELTEADLERAKEEAKKFKNALHKVAEQIRSGNFEYNNACEDIHTNIQNMLEKDDQIGDLILKLHTARSRNDQVLFDLKAFSKSALGDVVGLCKQLQNALKMARDLNPKVVVAMHGTKTQLGKFKKLMEKKMLDTSVITPAICELVKIKV